MSDVKLIEVDSNLHAQTNMRVGTRMVEVPVPVDQTVEVQAQANACLLQRVQVWDAAGRMHFEWEGRGSEHSIGNGSRVFANGPLRFGCQSLQDGSWIVNDLNVRSEMDGDRRRVIIKCEDGGDFPGDWDDLVVTLSWPEAARA